MLPRSRNSSPRNADVKQKYAAILPCLLFIAGCFVGHLHGRLFSADSSESGPFLLSSSAASIRSASVTNNAVTTTDAAAAAACTTSPRSFSDDTVGWKSIDVFYGKTDHLENMIPANKTWFSQASQDELVIGLLKGKRDGYFVDLAANDATLLSNTYALEKHFGWKGTCIEPNPDYWYNLTYRQNCHIVGAVAGQKHMEEVYFRFEAGTHGGIAAEGFDNNQRFQSRSVLKYTTTLEAILERTNAPTEIDYLSLDVEGAEEFIVMGFPLWDRYKIKIITAERLHGDMRRYFKANGYEFIKKLTRWGESLWIHGSVMDSLDMTALDRFDFPLF
jgi:hypothetical protein